MTRDSVDPEIRSDPEWALRPDELDSLRSTRRLFLLGLTVAGALALAPAALIVWMVGRQPHLSAGLVGSFLALVALAFASAWSARRAWILGRDIQGGRAEMRWGRLTRVWRHLRVVEVEGIPFPLQVTPAPALRQGERVRLRFAPRSRLTLEVHTLRQVIAAERLAGRPLCAGALAELGEEP